MRAQQRHEARQPWIAWILAAPMPVIGVAVGVYVSSVAFGREAEVTRAAGEEVCGLGGVPPLFAGFLGGVLGGILAGAVVAELVSWAVRRGRCSPRTDD